MWYDLKGFEGYYKINKNGQIKSLERSVYIPQNNGWFVRKERMLKPQIIGGYLRVVLTINKIRFNKCVHRLIAETFINNTNNKPCVNHKNGIKTDNRIENLEWVTNAENTQHAFKTGLMNASSGSKNGKSKLIESDIIEIFRLRDAGLSQQKISEIFNVGQPHISSVLRGKVWNHFKKKG